MTTERAKTPAGPIRSSKSAPKPNSPAPKEGAIKERAFLLWEKAGKPHGRDVEFWMKAKKELQS